MKALLVEAELKFARWIQDTLDDFRPGVFAVEHVGQLAAALERLGHGDIEIVLLDLMLPESSGIETFRRVFDAAAGVPIVILADASDGITFAETLRGGAQDFLMRRPLNGHTLFRSMLCAIERNRRTIALTQRAAELEAQANGNPPDRTNHHGTESDLVRRVLGDVAQNFHQLLQSVQLGSQSALSRLAPDHQARRDLEQISSAVEAAHSTSQQLLAFAQKLPLRPVLLDLNELVSETDSALRGLIGDEIKLVTALGPALGRVKADPASLRQILIGLALNARDAMPEGGRLTIETGNFRLGDDARDVPPGPYVMLSVSDSGCGMDEQTKTRLFEPFFTTRPCRGARGLGLAAAHGIVKQSGGCIRVFSEPGHGTSLRIFLPQVEPAAAPFRPAPQPSGKPQETILLVEDNAPMRKLIRQFLKLLGYTVLEAADGADALTVCESYDGTLHLVLTDISMPRLGGFELARRLVDLRRHAKVLFMSSEPPEVCDPQGNHLPPNAFLRKPFSPQFLAGKIRELLDSPPAAHESPPPPSSSDTGVNFPVCGESALAATPKQ